MRRARPGPYGGRAEILRPSGRLVWHPEHAYWHLEDYALYELRRVRDDMTPDWSPEGLVTPGVKASFCLIDIRQVDPEPPGHDPLASWPLYATCGENRQGISPGWADVYDYHLDGQQIPLTGVPDGVYALAVTANLDRLILESDYEDNVAWTLIEVLDGGKDVVER